MKDDKWEGMEEREEKRKEGRKEGKISTNERHAQSK